MKIRNINISLVFLIGAFIAFSGCSKDDGAIPSRVDVDAVPVITMPVDATGSQNITFTNQASFSGKFRAEMYFPNETPPTKVDIVVRKFSGTTANNNNVKVFRADVTQFPASFTVTAADLVTLFGPIALNDTYDFGPDTYVGTTKYEAFPVVGTPTGAGVIGMPLYKEYARFRAL